MTFISQEHLKPHYRCDCLQAGCWYCDSDGARTREQNKRWEDIAKDSENFLKSMDPQKVKPNSADTKNNETLEITKDNG